MCSQMSTPTLLPSFGAQRLARRPSNDIWHSASWSRCRRLNTASCHRLGWRSQHGRWSHLQLNLSWMVLLARPALLDARADVGIGWQSGRHMVLNAHAAFGANGNMPFHALVGITWSQNMLHGGSAPCLSAVGPRPRPAPKRVGLGRDLRRHRSRRGV